MQVGIDKINAAHCKALKERDTAASALRVELDKANTRVAELEKEMEEKEKSYADGVKALQEESARVKRGATRESQQSEFVKLVFVKLMYNSLKPSMLNINSLFVSLTLQCLHVEICKEILLCGVHLNAHLDF